VSAIRGYQLNRLCLPNPPLAAMRLALEGTIPTSRETFCRQDLGQPFTSPESRLTPELLLRCVSDTAPNPDLRLRTCVMGVDVGSKLHVVVRGRLRDRWHLLEAFTCDDFEELEGCFSCYQIGCCVVDGRPEQRAARAFQRLHPGIVWLCDYVPQGASPDWSWRDGVVRAPRTLVIDEMMHRLRSGDFVLPENVRELEGGAYLEHLQAPVRVVEQDSFGQPVARYKNRRRDDFAHAEVYATLATGRSSTGWVGQLNVGPQGIVGFETITSGDYDLR
jgi:hypothetical protein